VSGVTISLRQSGLPAAERRRRFGLLLLAIAAAFAIQGTATPGRWEQLIVSVLLALTLLLALRVAEAKARVFRPVAAIAGLLVAAALAEALAGNGNGTIARAANLLLVTLTPPAVVVGIIRTLRARNRVTIEAVFGVLCLYLLVGMFFAFLYGTIGLINGTFFAQNVRPTAANTLYFSFTTLTTTGYGDLTAASNLGHTLSVSEALFGQIYLVTVVAVIVSNLRPTPRAPGQGAEET
jgi:hypothetical protein